MLVSDCKVKMILESYGLRPGGAAQVVKRLSSKRESLSSNPRITKKNNNNKRN
jgi:hypothetical protein